MNVSFEEGLTILEAIARNNSRSTVSQIRSQTRFDERVIQETLKILEATKYIFMSHESSHVSLSLKLWSLGFCLKDPIALKRVADHYLSELALETRESACVGVIADDEIVLAAGIHVPEPAMTEFEAGTRMPVYDCAIGRAILAFQPFEVISEVEKRFSTTAAGEREPEALGRDLERIRSRGYAIHFGERYGMRCEIAAPIRCAGDVVEAAVGISGLSSRLTSDVIPALAGHILAAADGISRQLNRLHAGAA